MSKHGSGASGSSHEPSKTTEIAFAEVTNAEVASILYENTTSIISQLEDGNDEVIGIDIGATYAGSGHCSAQELVTASATGSRQRSAREYTNFTCPNGFTMTEDRKEIGDVVVTVTPGAAKYTCKGRIGQLNEEDEGGDEPATFAFTPHFALPGANASTSKKGRDEKLKQTEKFVFHGFKVEITGDPIAPGAGQADPLYLSAEGMSSTGKRMHMRLTILFAFHLVNVLRTHIRRYTMTRVAEIAAKRGKAVNSMSDAQKEAMVREWLLPPKASNEPCRLRVVMTIPNATKYNKSVVAAIYQQALSYACSAVFGPSSVVDVDEPPTHAFPAAHVRIVFESEASVSCVMTPDQKFNPSEVPKLTLGQHFVVADAGGSTLDLIAVRLTTRADLMSRLTGVGSSSAGAGSSADSGRRKGASLGAGAGATSSTGSGSSSAAASDRGLEAVLPNDGLAMGAAHVDRMLEEWIDTTFAADKEHPFFGQVKFSIIQAFAKRRTAGEKGVWNKRTDDVDALMSDHVAARVAEGGSGAGSGSGAGAGKRSASGPDGRPAKKSKPSSAPAGSGVSPYSIPDVLIRWTWSEDPVAHQLRNKYFKMSLASQPYTLQIPGSLIQEWYDTVFLAVVDKIVEYSERTRAKCGPGELCPVFCTGGMAQFDRFKAMLKHSGAIGEARTKEVKMPQMSVLVGLFQPIDSQYRVISRISESAIYVAAHPITDAEDIHPSVRKVYAYRVCRAGEQQVLNALRSFRLNFPSCSPNMNIFVYSVPEATAATLGAKVPVVFAEGQVVPSGHLDGLRYACGVQTVLGALGDHGYLTFQLGDCFIRAFLHIPAEKETHPAVFASHNLLVDYRGLRTGYTMGPHVPEASGRFAAASASSSASGAAEGGQGLAEPIPVPSDTEDEVGLQEGSGRVRPKRASRATGASDDYGPPPGLEGSPVPLLSTSTAAGGPAGGEPRKRGRPRKNPEAMLGSPATATAAPGASETPGDGRRARAPAAPAPIAADKGKGGAKADGRPTAQGGGSSTPTAVSPADVSGPAQPILGPSEATYNHHVLVEGKDVKARVTAYCYPTQIVKNANGEDVEVVIPGSAVMTKGLKVAASTYEHAALLADLWRIKLDGTRVLTSDEPLNFPRHEAVMAALATKEAQAGGRHSNRGSLYTMSQAKQDGSDCKKIAAEKYPRTAATILAALPTSAGGKSGRAAAGKR